MNALSPIAPIVFLIIFWWAGVPPAPCSVALAQGYTTSAYSVQHEQGYSLALSAEVCLDLENYMYI